ncbi:LuxR family transcriptional regulator [Actinoplanes sp. NPDC048796]|uniref:ATP-binding protein n=1 Tax=Actinoplanes sp. NPDC048796 TaxID=3155640 RepID=UPI0033C14E96
MQLVGREREMESLTAFLERAAGHGAVRLLYGDPGVGKSVLLDAAAALAERAGTHVLRATGTEFEADVSYAALVELLAPLTRDIGRLPSLYADALGAALGVGFVPAPSGPPAAAGGPAPSRLVLGNAVLALLRAGAAERPLLLVVDDLPWIDRASATILGFVARRLAGSRVGLLAASRTGEISHFERAGLPEEGVEPLAPAAARHLVDVRHPRLPGRIRSRLMAEADGNPLALLELAGTLSGERRPPDVLPLSDRLRAAFTVRLGGLPTSTRRLLLLAALDQSIDLMILRRAAQDVAQGLGAAEREQLIEVRPAANRLRFRHPLMRSAVVELATPAERREAHTVLAGLLADDPERRAWHLAAATEESDEKVAALLEDVARRVLRRGDASGAVTALTRAAELSPAPRDRSRRLAEAAYLGADITGELGSASRLLADARRVDPALGGSLHAAAAAAYMLVNGDGDVETAHAVLVGAIEAAGPELDAGNDDLIEALHTLLLVCWWAGRTELWAPLHDFVGRLTPAVPEQLDLQIRAFPDTARSTARDRAGLLAAIAQQDEEFEPNRIIRINTSSVYLDLLGGCRAGAWRLVEDGRAGGAVRSSLGALMHLCLDDFVTGRWAEGQELADEGLALCRSHNYDFIVWYFLYHQGVLAAVRGDHLAAARWADELTDVAERRHARGAARFAHQARALSALGRGDHEAAFRHASGLSPAGELAPYTPHALWVVLDLVESAWHTGRRAEARAHVEAMRAARLPEISPRLALLTAGCEAVVGHEELFAVAEATPGAGQWPFDLARIRLLHAERLVGRRAVVEARPILREALAAFEELGAAPWAERARRALRAAGGDQRQSGPESLTPQETQIARMAAAGLTNKEIAARLRLSPRSVGAHLYRIFPKLGIGKRAALRDALDRAPTGA